MHRVGPSAGALGPPPRRPAPPRGRGGRAHGGRAREALRRPLGRRRPPARRRRAAPEDDARAGALGLPVPVPLRRRRRVPRVGSGRAPARAALARGAPLRGVRAVGRARPHAHAGASPGRDVPRRGPRRGRGARALPRVPALPRPHVPAARPPRSVLAAVRAGGRAPRGHRPRSTSARSRTRPTPSPPSTAPRSPGWRRGPRLAAVRLVVVSRRPTDLLTEKQVRFLLLGTAVGILPLVVLNLVPRLLGGLHPDPLDARAPSARARARRVPRRADALPALGRRGPRTRDGVRHGRAPRRRRLLHARGDPARAPARARGSPTRAAPCRPPRAS